MEDWADWKKGYRHGVILVYPPETVRAPVNALRQRLDPVSFSYCEAHVSLTPPLRRAPSDDDWASIDAAARLLKPFTLEYGPVAAWMDQSVIYLEIRPLTVLAALRDALLATGLFPPPAHREFVPHMTIMEGLSGTKATPEILDELRRTVKIGSYLCDSVNYLRPNRDFRFVPERVIKLGG